MPYPIFLALKTYIQLPRPTKMSSQTPLLRPRTNTTADIHERAIKYLLITGATGTTIGTWVMLYATATTIAKGDLITGLNVLLPLAGMVAGAAAMLWHIVDMHIKE